jgi:cyd operon protein YbgT
LNGPHYPIATTRTNAPRAAAFAVLNALWLELGQERVAGD